MSTLFDALDCGCTYCLGVDTALEHIPWNPHPSFSGVSLKHVITSADTEGAFSAHLVRIEPECAIGMHAHETQWELHEVIGGNGFCRLGERMVQYFPGACAVLPKGEKHEVRAAEKGLELLAKFVPALV